MAMLHVKIVKEGGLVELVPCTHMQVATYEEDSPAVKSGLDTPGIRIELMPSGRIVRLPEDTVFVYILNEGGDTIDTLRWPLPDRKPSRTRARARASA